MAHCLISARLLVDSGYEMTTGCGAKRTKIDDPMCVLLQTESMSGLYQIEQHEFEAQLVLHHTVCQQ